FVVVQTAQNDAQSFADRAVNTRPGHQRARTKRHVTVQKADLSGVSRVQAQIDARRRSDRRVVAEIAVELLDSEIPLAVSRVQSEAIIVRLPSRLAQQLKQVAFEAVARIVAALRHAAAITGVDADGALREEFQVEVRNLLAQVVIS